MESGNSPESIVNNSVNLNDYVRGCSFPQCVSVTGGNFLSRKVQISCGDVLFLKSCDNGQVTLSYRNDANTPWTEVNVAYLNYPGKFRVLLPRDTSIGGRALSMFMYPTVADLLLDCPTYFEATSSYDDPYLPGMSVKRGDQFWFIGMVKNVKDGVTRLKVRDSVGNILILSPDCQGNFFPLEDENYYTIKELVDQAPVQRRLMMVNKETLSDSQNNNCENDQDTKQMEDRGEPSLYNLSINVHSDPTSLLLSFSGIIHMLKPESTIDVSPYNDLETTWTIPVSANLKVRTYSQNDYEIPASAFRLPQLGVPLPLTYDDELPKFKAPSLPPLSQPLVPIKIGNFVDIYCSSFPVKAKLVSTSEAHPFFQDLLESIEEVIVYRLDTVKRLYVKDTKSDTVYSLSQDVKLSFIEYPERFTTISELLHLPAGSEVTVLEDIAGDFPKPFSLRFGDTIRLTSNIPYLVKSKLPSQDCQVLKCERIDHEGGENTKLKLPLDLDVSMVITTNPNSRRLISMQDLLSGIVPIPSVNVASVPSVAEGVDLDELPVDLRILAIMTETCIVVASSSTSSATIPSTVSSSCGKTNVVRFSSNGSGSVHTVGLPVTSGIVLAFRERLDILEPDIQASDPDYTRLPVEKMTMTQFEEIKQQLKLNSDYEDLESGSNSTIEECGSERKKSTMTNSNGVLERKHKSTKMDKVRRLSRALNPKHWRHARAGPEPLPHPSAIGMASLSTRPKDDSANEYQEDQVDSDSINSESTKCGSTTMDLSTASDEVGENFYEDVEIRPIQSSPGTNDSPHRTGVFTGPSNKSLPLPRMPSNTFGRYPKTKVLGKFDSLAQRTIADQLATDSSAPKTNGGDGSGSEAHSNDAPKPFTRARNWATNLGNNIGSKLSIKPKEDAPQSSKDNYDPKGGGAETVASTAYSSMTMKYRNLRPPDSKPPLPPQEADIKNEVTDEKKDIRSPPKPQARQRCGKPLSSIESIVENQNGNEKERELAHQQDISTPIRLNDSIFANNTGTKLPKPKPRGLKILVPSEKDQTIQSSPQPKSRKGAARSDDLIKDIETLSVEFNSSSGSSETSMHITAKDNRRPLPPPKPRITVHTTV